MILPTSTGQFAQSARKVTEMASKQINMADVVVQASVVVQNASDSSAVSVKEAAVLAVVSANKFGVSCSNIASVKGIEAKSVPGIVAALNKKGYIVGEKLGAFGNVYVASAEGAEVAELLK